MPTPSTPAPADMAEQLRSISETLLAGQWPTPDRIDYLRDAYRAVFESRIRPVRITEEQRQQLDQWDAIKKIVTRTIGRIAAITPLDVLQRQHLDFTYYEPDIWDELRDRAAMATDRKKNGMSADKFADIPELLIENPPDDRRVEQLARQLWIQRQNGTTKCAIALEICKGDEKRGDALEKKFDRWLKKSRLRSQTA
jgi:hypothetical protein